MTAAPDVDADLDLIRAAGIHHFNEAARFLAKGIETNDTARRHDFLDRSQRHTELAKAAGLLTRSR